MNRNLDGNTSAAAGTGIPSSAPFGGTFPHGKAGNGLPRACGPRNDGGRGIPSSAPAGHLPPRGRQRARIKRAAAALGWLCALAIWIVVAAMESGVLRPLAGGMLGLGLELIGALALYKAGVIRLPASEERGERIAAAGVRAGFAMTGDGREPLHRLRRSPSPEGEAMTEDDGRRRTDRW